MKRLFLLLLTGMLALHSQSQYRVEVETGEKKMSKGDHTAFTVLIPDAKADEVVTSWRKYVNIRPAGERIDNLNTQIGNIFRSKENRVKRNRLKMAREGEELHISAVEIDYISNSPMDVYANVTQLPEGSQLSAFFQFTNSAFVNESNVDENRFSLIKDYVRKFGVQTYKSVKDDQIKTASRNVSREEGRLKDLQSSTNREEKSIIRNQNYIQEFKARIAELKIDSARMVKTIDSKKDDLSRVDKDSAEYVVAEKELRSLEKEKQGYNREIRTLKNRIKSKELDIISSKNQITENALQMENQEKIIENKQEIAEQLIREKGEIE